MDLPCCRAVFFLLITTFSLSSAATIRSLSVKGNSKFTAREIAGWLVSRPGIPYTELAMKNDCRLIEDTYRAEGYLAARAVADQPAYTSDSARVDLIIAIDEGRRSLVGRLAVEGSTRLSSQEILEQFDLAAGSPMNEGTVERDIEALLTRYEKLGYPFARCEVVELGHRAGDQADSVDIRLRVDEGRRMTLDEIRVEGNKETDPSVIVRETRFEPGEPFNPTKVNAIRQRLNRLNIFSSVAEPTLYVRDDKGGLLIKVQEGNTSTFDGVLGYIPPSSPGESAYLTGLVSVSMRSLFGTGRKMSLRWQREDRYSQEIAFRYIEPWLFGAPVNLGGGFLQRQQDTAYVRRTLDVKAELMFSEELSISLVLKTDRVIPSGDSSTTRAVGTSSTTAGVEVEYDTRDDLASPTSGARYRADYHYGRKSVSSVPASAVGQIVSGGTLQRAGLDVELFLPAFRRQVIAIGVHGREVTTEQVQEGEMYRFGGANTLRGYRENEFLGASIAWTNAEYRFLLARRTFVFGFFDTGYYFRPTNDVLGLPSSEAFRYGYGVGVRVETPLGNIGVSFALGEGDSFGTAKIHIGLINDF